MIVLADIGGTYARFALEQEGELTSVRKYVAADYASLEEALGAYCGEIDRPSGGTLSIATAAVREDNVWRFSNKNQWIIDPETLKRSGWEISRILNDFEAALLSLAHLPPSGLVALNPGADTEHSSLLPRCLTGPGTGLGLGYLIPLPGGGFHAQRTHGGHMLLAALTPEQKEIAETVQRLRPDKTIPVFEHVVSGPGLMNLYRAVCALKKYKEIAQSPAEILEDNGSPAAEVTLRLFHEFFGLFAHTAVVTGHAYGGLYLTGGILERLVEKNLFDFTLFKQCFILNNVSPVKKDLESTPIYRVSDPCPALRGLLL
ncbi:MAG: glucokinase [Alphaproteobacteria bacterium]|nr:glucokinase [Alphaproteobacteria bacterium]